MQKNASVIFVLLLLTHLCLSQKADSINKTLQLKGAVTITTKGISFVPTFTLGKPAAIFDLSIGKRKLFFEPQLRFSLKGRPWSFLFWGRYNLVMTDKFQMNVGSHLGLNFRTDSFAVNGTPAAGAVVRRYLAGELAPNYFISKNISIGAYYMYSRGLDDGTTKNTHFVTINSNISNINLGNQFYARITPQLYYLALDARDGLFVTSTFNLVRKNFPLSLQSLVNKSIETDIPGGGEISMEYQFDLFI